MPFGTSISKLNDAEYDALRLTVSQAERQKELDSNLELWNEDKTSFGSRLYLDGASYDAVAKQYQIFDTAPAKKDYEKHIQWSARKTIGYCNRILPKGTTLETAQGKRRGRVSFSTDIIIPTLYTNRRDMWGRPEVWMSITPMEVFTQRSAVREAKGKVLIGGLGLGWLLRKMAAKPRVTEVIVVELSEELLNWYGKDLCTKIAEKTGKKITVIQDDVIHHVGKHGKDCQHFIDIWLNVHEDLSTLSDEWIDVIWKMKVLGQGHFWGWTLQYDWTNVRYGRC